MYTKVNFFKVLAVSRIFAVMLKINADTHIKAIKLAVCTDLCNEINGGTFQVLKLVEVKTGHIIDK